MRRLMIMPLLLAIAVFACGKSEQKSEDRLDADVLYTETCRLVKTYTDSMKQACDSASVVRTIDLLQQHLDSLNNKLRADSDFKLTAGQNDTIYMLMSEYNRIRDKKTAQYCLSIPDTLELLPEAADTLQAH